MRKLGQHFLINRAAIKKIVGAVHPRPGETIIEIGAGHGELTVQLQIAKCKSQIVALEKDKNLAEYLKQRFSGIENIEIIEGDVLKILPVLCATRFATRPYKLVGNLPYYITGRLLRLISELSPKPSLSVFTIQEEVAERIAASPPRMNRLAAAVQFWAEPKIIAHLHEKDFSPPPGVASAVISLAARETKRDVGGVQYYRAVRIIFQQPRQTIANNLRRGRELSRSAILALLGKLGLPEDARPQDLSISQIEKLAILIS